MSASLKKLYMENENPFKLSLCAGQNSIRNKVTWVYMLEDEYIIPYFHGSNCPCVQDKIVLGTKSLGSICWKTSILFLIFTVLNLL